MDSDGYIKITDFGLSKEEISGNTGANSFCGTPEYLAPEVLAKKGHGKGVDWWSLGALIYEMITGLPPFYSRDRNVLFNNIMNADLTYPDYLSPEVKDLLSHLFVKNPDLRLGSGPAGSQNVKNHRWFRDVNWDALIRKQLPAPFIPNSSNPIVNFENEFTKQPALDSLGKEEAKLETSPTFQDFSYRGSSVLDNAKM